MNIKVNGVNISLEDNNGNAQQVQQSAPKKSNKKLIAGLCILGGLGVISYKAAGGATGISGMINGGKAGYKAMEIRGRGNPFKPLASAAGAITGAGAGRRTALRGGGKLLQQMAGVASTL